MLDFAHHPGRAFVLATLLPLAAAVLLFCVGGLRNFARGRYPRFYWFLGGDASLPLAGLIALLAILTSAGLAGWGLFHFYGEAKPEHWSESVEWFRLGSSLDKKPSAAFELGYRIDRLSAPLFAMVAGIGSLIFLFSLGYMKGETKDRVEDHTLHLERRGRFGRFFLYLSFFAFSMFQLLIAGNLLQVFIGWELVGVSSFFLIGFYYERKSASTAANKAFIVNRIGDAGFLIGIAIAFTQFGTLNIEELNRKCEHGLPTGMSQALWIAMGIGIFLGAVGKSAQVPLQTWLPDAMEGPTPVSALIHAATMVAAGVYLVARCYPMFAPEVLLGIAYTGLVTLLLSAAVALVATDIKRVLAFSTCSQLGYMMLALGVGGWSAAVFHLLTHAFFKALLFLGAGSTIHGLHHEQDLRKMGGLRKKMPITAYAMLVGVLAISGAPLFSGWYSKDAILAAALGFGLAEPVHFALFVGPLFAAGLTAFYMFRLWFLAFGGKPRDQHLYDHARESPLTMSIPLILLALCSLGIAWGWPIWDADASELLKLLKSGEPHGGNFEAAHHLAHENHLWAGGLALIAAATGVFWAWRKYGRGAPSESQLSEPRGLLAERWYFDAVYDFAFVRGTVKLAQLAAKSDRSDTGSRFNLDGWMSGFARLAQSVGGLFRKLQTGRIRFYVLALALTVLGLLGMLTARRWTGM